MASYIGNAPTNGEFKKLDSIQSLFNGALTEFDLEFSSISQSVGDPTQLIVSLNGVVQEPGAAYILGFGGNSIIFSTAPASSDQCYIALFGGIGGTATPTDGSVTSAKIAVQTGDVSFADNAKAKFGAGNDLAIYSDGTNSRIEETGPGSLIIKGTQMIFQSAAGENLAYYTSDGSVNLYHNGSSKLATTSNGIDVTGTVTADGLVVDGNSSYTAKTRFAHGATNYYSDWGYASDGNKVYLKIADGTAAKNVFSANYNGDISFYEDTGTTPKFFWDASAESLGIGTSSPTAGYKLDVSGNIILSSANPEIRFNGGGGWIGNAATANTLTFNTSALERLRIDNNGNMFLGKTDTTFNTPGFAWRYQNVLQVTRANDTPLEANRTGNDGKIAEFYKDAVKVGAIGCYNGVPYIGYANGAGGGIMFNGLSIEPTGVGATRTNGNNDIGSTNYRWKDLHLSGSVNGKLASATAAMVTATPTSASAQTIISTSNAFIDWNIKTTSNSSWYSISGANFTILKSGLVSLNFNQDIITVGATGYAQCGIYINGTAVSQQLITNTDGQWDCIHNAWCGYLNVNDYISVKIQAANISSLDVGSWSNYQLMWIAQ